MFVDKITLTGMGDGYEFSIPSVRSLAEMGGLELSSPVTFLVGENGSGKSTLIEAVAIACGFNPEGGSLNYSFSTEDSHSSLCEYIRIARRSRPRDGFFLRAESFYNAITYLDGLDKIPAAAPKLSRNYGGKSLHNRSHGESFLTLVTNRFGGNGLYILDEPESALSPDRCLSLLSAMDQLVKKGSQFIVATHSPILTAYPSAQIYELSEDGLRPVEWKDTQIYRTTRSFLESPERILRYLFED